jgi:branched-chain amino acid transport system ATP-binding protein
MSVLEVSGLHAGYGGVTVLHDLSLVVEQREVAVLLGANGAGKTTTLRALSGLVERSGRVLVEGVDVSRARPAVIARRRVAHVPEGRGTFMALTVEENLMAGALTRPRQLARTAMQQWFDYFPRLAERRDQVAGTLSGGEQQMLAISRAMMLDPVLLLLDEPSMGLAPNITARLFEVLRTINHELGTSMLIVEQNAALAMSIADQVHVLETGRVVAHGTTEQMRDSAEIRDAYLGADVRSNR